MVYILRNLTALLNNAQKTSVCVYRYSTASSSVTYFLELKIYEIP